jgi:hypothetical protein
VGEVLLTLTEENIRMIYRCILPDWAKDEFPYLPKVKEGEFNANELRDFNETSYYNIYYLPNYPSVYKKGVTVDGSHIDTFTHVFIDMDLKEGIYQSVVHFLETLYAFPLIPTKVVESGNGVHAYWKVSDLDGMSYLTLQRRLCRHFKTDEAVSKIYQLMRVPGTINTKNPNDLKYCETLEETKNVYTCEQLDQKLPIITREDEAYCKAHYAKTYEIDDDTVEISEDLPVKFGALLKSSEEVSSIWKGDSDDRSKSDYRLGHIMFASGFTKEEALSVLVNSAKALARGPKHRVNYATNIVDKIWTYELEPQNDELDLSMDVRQILERSGDTLKGTRFPCYKWLDNTDHGFRLGQVLGLVAGSGVGKTAVALNMFMGFVALNPDYHHFFVPLEQPANEIADRWKTLCGTNTALYEKVHVISNYDKDNNYRHLSFDEIKDYLLKFQRVTGKKIGCVVIDHIGALHKKGAKGENQDLTDICHSMKAFAVQTNTMLIMQSQAPREKAGIGDLELNKDAAYGTVYFEAYCDYLVTVWQPLKRCYDNEQCPTVTALKFCKIRHKKMGKDFIKEDVRYTLLFDPHTEKLREMTQDEETAFTYFNTQSTNLRKQDRKTDILVYTTIRSEDGKTNDNQDSASA